MCLAAVGIIGGIVSAIGSIAGAAVAAAGARQEANARAQEAQYAAKVDRNNATAEAYKYAEASQDTAIKGKYALARQRAAFASAGVQVDTGTPVTVFGLSSGRIEGDIATEQYAGKTAAIKWTDQAKLDELRAANELKAGDIKARAAIISGVTGAASSLVRVGGGFGQSLSGFG